MSIVSSTLSSLHYPCGLIPFITAGSPSINSTEKALLLLDQSGADIIEIGLPYSDPLADGPVIQEASSQALSQGMNLDILLDLLHRVKDNIQAPLVLFTYYNPVLSRGVAVFLQEIAAAGIKGIIIPDLPLEESDYVIEVCNALSIELILLVTPTSPSERIDNILDKSQGLIYVVSSTGVTGMRDEINNRMEDFIARIRLKTDKLIMIGFGISKDEHVRKIMNWNVDGIVIGSAFVNCLSDPNPDEGLKKLQDFCLSVGKTLRSNPIG
uniref:Tryptophan synthase alpha chain n=1 Tax=Helminthora furcellata TaxID=1884666 RepID=A0A1G4NR05_9FLOR|nr:Tryptophan synthase alpha subunit [Helminthora furcellata]SCW21088.1 Tryptophan synthase alpha subunit [Helminthora furcellata]SCW23948.1 Tryptophan synthase alpha subunit [Helminthora furcellata]